MADIVLQYKRVDELSSGQIIRRDQSKPVRVLFEFEKLDFAHMMSRFSSELQEYFEDRAVVERTDRAGLQPMVMEPEVVRLLREDPVAAIKSMTFGPVIVDARKSKLQDVPSTFFSPPSVIRAGYDALAETFGDELYIRYKDLVAECPCCGRWGVVKDGVLTCSFPRCKATFPISVRSKNWAAIQTSTLLESGSSNFWFPREWNKGRSWISYEELETKYKSFREAMKEVQSCSVDR